MVNPNIPYIQPSPYVVQPMAQTVLMPMQTVPLVQTVPATTIIAGTTGVLKPFYRDCQIVLCNNCQSSFPTRVNYEPGKDTWILCLGLGLIIGPFSSFVLCTEEFKDCNHFCAKCGMFLGKVEYSICN